MATWEYLAQETAQKNLVVRRTLPRTAGTYGETHVYDVERPEVTVSLQTTDGLTAEEREDLMDEALAPGGQATVTDNAGTTWSGRIVTFSAERLSGSDLFKGSLTIRPMTDEPA